MQALLSRFGLDRFPSKQESNLYVVTVPQEVLLGTVKSLLADHGFDLKTVVATDERQAGRDFVIRYVFGLPKESVLVAIEIDVDRYALSFPSLVFVSQSFSLYEQEIKSMFGLEPVGHPAPNRIISIGTIRQISIRSARTLRGTLPSRCRPRIRSRRCRGSKVRGFIRFRSDRCMLASSSRDTSVSARSARKS